MPNDPAAGWASRQTALSALLIAVLCAGCGLLGTRTPADLSRRAAARVDSMEQLERDAVGRAGVSCVMYSLPWCARCRALAPHFESLAFDRADRAGFFVVDMHKVPAASRKYNVWRLPTVVIYTGGKEVQRIVQPRSRRKLEKTLDRALAARSM